MNKKNFYAAFMQEIYPVLIFALGGSLFYYLGTQEKRAILTFIVLFVLYTVWHFAEYKRQYDAKAKLFECEYSQANILNPVSDFAVPRYVYENGLECKTPNSENGRVIGYRIGSDLVILAKTLPASGGWYREDVEPCCQTYGGKLLNHNDVVTLRYYWDKLDEMREAVGQMPLPLPYFWYQAEFSIEAAHYRADINEVDPSYSAIILKF